MRKATYKRLINALTETLQNIPYEELTVQLLCEKANITRRTFYNNYKSIDEIIKKIFLEMLFDECYSKMKDESYFESDHFIMTMIKIWNEYGSLFLALEKWHVLEYLTKDNAEIITTVIQEKCNDPFIKLNSHYLIASIYASIFNICMVWLKTGKKESTDELLKIIRRFVYRDDYYF